jgi:hypothetical protein
MRKIYWPRPRVVSGAGHLNGVAKPEFLQELEKACLSFGLTHSHVHPCDVRYTRYTVTPVHLQRLMTF